MWDGLGLELQEWAGVGARIILAGYMGVPRRRPHRSRQKQLLRHWSAIDKPHACCGDRCCGARLARTVDDSNNKTADGALHAKHSVAS